MISGGFCDTEVWGNGCRSLAITETKENVKYIKT